MIILEILLLNIIDFYLLNYIFNAKKMWPYHLFTSTKTFLVSESNYLINYSRKYICGHLVNF